MEHASSNLRRLLAAVAITAGAWLVAPSPAAHAAPAQVMTEYGATLEAGAKAADAGNAAGSGAKSTGDKIGDIVDEAKKNTPLLIIGGGLLAVAGLWKVVTR